MKMRPPISKAEKKELATIKRQIDDLQQKLVARETEFLGTLLAYLADTQREVAQHNREVDNLLEQAKSVFYPSETDYMGWCQDALGEGILTDTVSLDLRHILNSNPSYKRRLKKKRSPSAILKLMRKEMADSAR